MKNIVQRLQVWKICFNTFCPFQKTKYIYIYQYIHIIHTHAQKESNLAQSTAIVDATRFSHVWQSTAVKKPRYCDYNKRLCTFKKG